MDKHEAGPELDAVVAETRMGWKWVSACGASHLVPHADDLVRSLPSHWDHGKKFDAKDITTVYSNMSHLAIPRYSRDIAATWMVVDPWNGDFDLRRQNGRWRATFFRPSEEFEAWAATPELAICLAALQAAATKGVENG